LASTILLLAIHQDVQEKVYKEIIAVNPKNEAPNMDILNDMTYMTMVIYENLRLIPTIPVIGRKALEDFDIGDGVLKRGMTIYMNIFSMHRNQDVWGKDSNDFKPERFQPEEIEKRPVGSFTPFGRGQRSCIGE
jgi:cytochrome P450